MFASWQRRRWRAQMTPLINSELPAAEAARARAAIAADPVLAAELGRLEIALSAVRALPETALPSHFSASLAAELDLCDQPLRARYSDLLDGLLSDAEANELRRGIAEAPELAGEFAFLSRVVEVCRSLPEEPMPIGFAHSLARKLDAVDATREVATRRSSQIAPRRNLAFAGALAVVLGCGWVATRFAPPRLETGTAPVATQPAPAPELEQPAPPQTAVPDLLAETVGEPPAAKPVAEVVKPTPSAAAVGASPARASRPPAPRTTRRHRTPMERVAVATPTAPPARLRNDRPRAEAVPPPPRSTPPGEVPDVTPVTQPPRHSLVPSPPPTVTPEPPSLPERQPLTGVVIAHDSQPRVPAAAPSREIPSPGTLNRYAATTVALEFTTASLTEASLPRATLPDLDFGGVD